MTRGNSVDHSSRSKLIDLCYVRLAVQQPQLAAAFAADILGLQPVPDKHALLFRSDHRYHTLSLATNTTTSSIGIEMVDEAALDYAEQELKRADSRRVGPPTTNAGSVSFAAR
jgi:2,3-dihydroxy-p-cumate/2,3-dihydroxybenzoate 3,4-dioxygenase